ncbi:phosphodiester glycosidase family protein [Candidatus Microgenomates bacterium]|nr:phosphodiester glycosidase family protein [Candidatus Microgenomates bacterium]
MSVRLQSGLVTPLILIIVLAAVSVGAFSVFRDFASLQPNPTPSPTPADLIVPPIPIQSGPTPTPSFMPTSTSSPTPKPTVKPALTPTPTVQAVSTDNVPPNAGFKRQSVRTDAGTFTVSIVAADLGSTRVIVDTISTGDCGNDCPVLSLKEYAARNNAFAGVNGSYFCPASYPSCAGKTNSFDTLLMNKDKTYFNSGNNVYSTVPAVIFGSGWTRFVKQSLEWGRDTGVDAVIANYPLLTFNNAIEYGGSSDPKLVNKGGRSFIGATGETIYMGVVHSATVAEAAQVMMALGIHNSLNLDDGGSTALWYGGYKAGPGRDIPNAILFVRK